MKKSQKNNPRREANLKNLSNHLPQMHILPSFLNDEECYTRSTAVTGLLKEFLKLFVAASLFVLMILLINELSEFLNFESANDLLIEAFGVVFGTPALFVILLSLNKSFDLFYLILTGKNFDVAGEGLKSVKIIMLVIGFVASLAGAILLFFYITDTISDSHKRKELSKEQKKFITILDQGRASWNEYITRKPMVRIKFAGADLSEREFKGYFFKSVKFSNANLDGTIFNDCYLGYADFNEASCNGTIFKNSYLQGSDFIKTDLTKARFENSYGSKDDFNRAKISNETVKQLIDPEKSRWNNVNWYDYHDAKWLKEKGYYHSKPPKGLKY